MTRRMTWCTISTLLIALFAIPAAAAEMPSRKAGLWEIKMEGANGLAMRQCVDATTDQALMARVGSRPDMACSKRDVQKSGDTVTVDSSCTIAGRSVNSHVVMSGNFDSAYKTTVTTSDGRTITTTVTWLGACAADQKPGDTIMPNGMKINILDIQKRGMPGAPPPAVH